MIYLSEYLAGVDKIQNISASFPLQFNRTFLKSKQPLKVDGIKWAGHVAYP